MLGQAILALAALTQAPGCSLAGPSVRARWADPVPPVPQVQLPLKLLGDFPLPGSASRFDYQSLDPESGRLFISHMGAGRLVVFDVRAGKVVANLDGFPRVTGVLAVPAEHHVYGSATGDHAVVVTDLATLKEVARVPGPRFPDGIAYAPDERRVFVSDESGGRDYVVDAVKNTLVTSIDLGGEAGNTHYDPGSHCILVAVQTANQMAVIDPATATIVRRISFDKSLRYPHGFYVDAPDRLAFVTGQESATLGVFDLQTLQLKQVLPIGDDPDVLAFDSTTGLLFVAAESGVVSVFQRKGGQLAQLGWYRAPKAHTVAVDPSTHRVYLPLADVGGRPVLRVLQSTAP